MTDAAAQPGAHVPDPRPRPQYGEYATPEEQRARIRQPDATDALSSGQALDDSAAEPPTTKPVPGPAAAERTAAGPQPMSRGRFIDRAATFGLLGYGLFNVITSATQLFSFEEFADSYLSLAGIDGTFTNLAQGRLFGTIAALVLIFGWIATAFLTWRNLRRGRISFWIPLVGAVVVGLVATVFICIPIFGDPSFAEWFTNFGGSAQ